MNSKLKNEQTTELFEAIKTLDTIEEYYDFFEDLCTVAELNAMVQRFQVAKMLDDDMQYNDIVNKSGASTATISRVKKSLNYGADGYRRVLDRLEKK